MDDTTEMNMVDALLNVMLVDEQPGMRSILRQLLRQEGIEQVTEAENGRMAYDLLHDPETATPDVIVSELHMAEMDGLELVHQLRREKNRTPVLILTGDETKLLHEVTEQVGANKVLLKPISATELSTEIHLAVGIM